MNPDGFRSLRELILLPLVMVLLLVALQGPILLSLAAILGAGTILIYRIEYRILENNLTDMERAVALEAKEREGLVKNFEGKFAALESELRTVKLAQAVPVEPKVVERIENKISWIPAAVGTIVIAIFVSFAGYTSFRVVQGRLETFAFLRGQDGKRIGMLEEELRVLREQNVETLGKVQDLQVMLSQSQARLASLEPSANAQDRVPEPRARLDSRGSSSPVIVLRGDR